MSFVCVISFVNDYLSDHHKISIIIPGMIVLRIMIYRGASTSSSNLICYGGFTEGQICKWIDKRLIFFATERIMTVYYCTNGRNIRSDVTGLQIAYD